MEATCLEVMLQLGLMGNPERQMLLEAAGGHWEKEQHRQRVGHSGVGCGREDMTPQQQKAGQKGDEGLEQQERQGKGAGGAEQPTPQQQMQACELGVVDLGTPELHKGVSQHDCPQQQFGTVERPAWLVNFTADYATALQGLVLQKQQPGPSGVSERDALSDTAAAGRGGGKAAAAGGGSVDQLGSYQGVMDFCAAVRAGGWKATVAAWVGRQQQSHQRQGDAQRGCLEAGVEGAEGSSMALLGAPNGEVNTYGPTPLEISILMEELLKWAGERLQKVGVS